MGPDQKKYEIVSAKMTAAPHIFYGALLHSDLAYPTNSIKEPQMEKDLNTFKGRNSIKDFLNPGKHPYLPLVELPEDLNSYSDSGVRIFAKLMTFLPLGNVKCLAAYNMLSEMDSRGELKGVEQVIENSSGNTVFSIAMVARMLGIDKIKSFVPTEVSWGKLLMLRFFGVEPIVNQEPTWPDSTDPTSGIYKAQKLGKSDGWINPGQYNNEDNPKAHQKWTGKQIWEQTEGKISVFCAGLGTTGTIIGTSTYLKKQKNKVQVVGVMREADTYTPGVRTKALLRLIGFNWQKHVDDIQKVETAESYKNSMELSRRGILVGPSSGFALAGLLKYLEQRKNQGSLDELRDKNGEIVCVFICPDSPMLYLDEYFKYLAEHNFPKIENEELLLNKPQ